MSWKMSQINVVMITKYKEGITVNSASPPLFNQRIKRGKNHSQSK